MTVGFALKIVGAVLALIIGVWLGMPGRYEQTIDDIDEVMESGMGRRKKVQRRFTAVAWMQRQVSVRTRGSRGPQGRGFNLESPDDR